MNAKEKILRKKIAKVILENMSVKKSYYVKNSSWFNTHPYNSEEISSAVESAGGENVRMELAYGWTNQPEVVVFDATMDVLPQIEQSVQETCGTEWIIIHEKDW